MKINKSAEDYLETILILKKQIGEIRSIDIANKMNYSKASVSVAMKNLRENSYIVMNENGYITFTDKGLSAAKGILEKHEILTKALMFMGVCEAIAKEDACKIEHEISDETFLRIKEFVNSQLPKR